ncbi:MAG: potassium transporter [Spirochaetales bacterium]|nr:MAG: potassium transporter [Spirochaetales bacterium]
MRRGIHLTQKTYLLVYFIGLMIFGCALLYLPVSFRGPERLTIIDALFTSVSAVCVTGLITVDTALYTTFGKLVILFLIQSGGLGIITFSTLYLATPRRKISLASAGMIKTYYLDSVEYKARNIVREIIITTFLIELAGSLVLFAAFRKTVPQHTYFTALFHSVSAFCNAGFSLFSSNLEAYAANVPVLLVIPALIFTGGIGFVVIRDCTKRVSREKKHLSLHSKLALSVSAALIAAGTLAYLILESRGAFKGMPFGLKFLNAFFQAVTDRTAGFDTINQAALSVPSKVLTLPLMFIGGSPGSISGGIKVTTFFLIIGAALKSRSQEGELAVFNRNVPPQRISQAQLFFIKALIILFSCIFLLTITENIFNASHPSFIEIVFESFSAFGTVGLSLGITAGLSAAGKIVIILTMFAGRVGLILIAIPGSLSMLDKKVDYPEGEVLIG